MSFEILNPPSLSVPRGWNNGLLAAPGGRVLFVAGQVGCEHGNPPGFTDQFAIALDRVLAVVAAAGGRPSDVGRMTIYVTELTAYRESLESLGRIWRERLGSHYPAIALLEVKGLVDPGAKVEIEATAVIGAAS